MSTFVDECNLHVKAGDGGAGCVSFRREAHVAFGGPNGGSGGDGGSIFLEANHNVSSLLAFADHPHRRAADGGHGRGSNQDGANGKNTTVFVPTGTAVFSHSTREPLADLVRHGERWLAALGGEGGSGNAKFLSNRRRAPKFAERGEEGEQRWLFLELKLLADVAIVGLPNVGKSTLISRVSAAKPKIANYPFTTLRPNLGVVRLDDDFEMVVADIPGLVEGASKGKGLGLQFLRHIERSKALLVLLDGAEEAGLDCGAQEKLLLSELGAYKPELLDLPRLVVVSRSDLGLPAGSSQSYDLAISAVVGDGIGELLSRLAKLVAASRDVGEKVVGPKVHRPRASQIQVSRDDDGAWRVIGRSALRAVALSDLSNFEAIAFANERLERLGVDAELSRAGAKNGDTVRVGDLEFEYEK